jgi:hypothetical protein
MFRRTLFVTLLGLALPAAYANPTCNDACQSLVREGQVLQGQGNYQQALAKLKEAASAEPQSSIPLSSQAFSMDGQLEPTILILLYKESYRPALEKWMAVNPQGINAFVTRYGLPP